MKRQGRQAESFCTAPDRSVLAALIFGKPGAPVSELAESLSAKWIGQADPPLDRKRMSPEEARAEPDVLLDNLFSESLFGGASLVQVTISRETEARPFLDALDELEKATDPPAGRLLIIAGDLGPRSKLRKTFETADRAVSLQLFERTEREFEAWVKSRLTEQSVKLEPDAETLLVNRLLEDQSLAASEIEKLAVYAHDQTGPLGVSDIRDLVVLEDQSTGFDLIDLSLDGETEKLNQLLLDQLREANAAIPVLIGLLNQVKRLLKAHEISASGINGPKIGEKLFPRIYDRQWPAFERRMSRWAPERLLTVVDRIEMIDRQCRRAGSPQEALVCRLLIDIAQIARAASRRHA